MAMSIFRKSKSFKISERDPTYKVKYLGNVQTSMMKGDGCVDKPVKVLWENYVKNAPTGLEMKLKICASGLKAETKQQGLTEYRAHRISYCVAHPKYPKLFVWVYRHEGKIIFVFMIFLLHIQNDNIHRIPCSVSQLFTVMFARKTFVNLVFFILFSVEAS